MDELKELKRSGKEKRLIESVYLIQLMIDSVFRNNKNEKDQCYEFFLNTEFVPEYIRRVYYEGVLLNKEDRKMLWKNFLRAKVELKLNDQDAITYAKLSVLISPHHINSLYSEIRTYNNKKSRWTYGTKLSANRGIINLAFRLRHLKGANAWVQDLAGVKTLKDDEKAPFEITKEQASELIHLSNKQLDSYVRLRLTIPQIEHEIAQKAAFNVQE